jgi:ABC-2 type transport system permease protein
MNALVKSEFVKLSTDRSSYGVLAALLAIMVVGVVAIVTATTTAEMAETPLHRLPFLQFGPTGLGLVILLLGIRSFTDDFRHGTITPTLLVNPLRSQVVVAKMLAFALLGLAFSLIADAIMLAVAVPLIASRGVDVSISAGDLLATLGGVALGTSLGAAIGVGVGAVVRHRVPAIVGAIIWILVVETFVTGRWPDVGKFLPGQAANNLAQQPGELAPWTGGFVLGAYVAVWGAAALIAMHRRDIT